MTFTKTRQQTLVVLFVIGCLFRAELSHAQTTTPKKGTAKKNTTKPRGVSKRRPQKKQPRTSARRPRTPENGGKAYFSVYRLRHVKAEALVGVINNMFVNFPYKVANDLKNNSLLVYAGKEQHESIKNLLVKLDADRARDEQLKMFHLVHVKADEKLIALLRTAVGSTEKKDLSLAFDANGNRLIARGKSVDLQVLEQLLKQLDTPSELNRELSGESFTVRIIWLSTDKSLQKEPQILSRDMRPLVQTLEKAGIRSPRMVNQLMITTATNQDFAVSGKAKTGKKRWSISVEGELLMGPKMGEKGKVVRYSKPMIRITVTTNPEDSKVGKGKPDLRTTIPAPINSYAVLGMSPNAEGNNLFVIRVERKR